jgi:23S rRNA (adenine2503-C2)-methyltransferase
MKTEGRINLTGLTRSEFQTLAETWGEKPYRGRQLFSWIYQKKVDSFEEMTDISRFFRSRLPELASLGHLTLLDTLDSSASSTTKYLFALRDNLRIETVLIRETERRTLCISSQVGCALGCQFCATGDLGLKRNMTSGEIVDQVLSVERLSGEKMTNVVYMGMGEPFYNYENVIKSAQLINHQDGIAISTRHIVISTAGVVPSIHRFADEGHKYKLAISLNSPFDEERGEIMPIARKWNLEKLLDAVRYYVRKTAQRPTFEYVLISRFNDSRRHADALCDLVKDIPCKINVIPYNPASDRFARPSNEHIEKFTQWLRVIKAPVAIRWSKGTDIESACGQLVGNGGISVGKK